MFNNKGVFEVKKQLRKELKHKRDSISPILIDIKSNNIKNYLLGLSIIENSKNIMVFVSFGSEPNTHELIKHFIDNKKRVYVPYIDTNFNEMFITEITSFSDLETGYYGILEPKIKNSANPELLDVIITPAIAFDKQNYRLGYGKAYYDKFFSTNNLKAYKIGICFSENFVDLLPHSENDVPVDEVIHF